MINPEAYEVGLPPESRIHPIFHVSPLRKALLPGMQASTVPPTPSDVATFPLKILAHRWRRSPAGRRKQVQVQWSDPTVLDITWEDQLELQQRFTAAPAWGQVDTQGGGDVSTHNSTSTLPDYMGLDQRRNRPKRLVQPNRRYHGPDWDK